MSLYIYYYGMAAVAALFILAIFATVLLQRRSRRQDERQRFVEQSVSKGRRGWFGLGRRQDETQSLLQAWVGNRIDDPDMKRWFRGLSQNELRDITEDLKAFCLSYGFDVKWVLNNGFNVHPDLQAQVNQALVYRLQSHQQTKRTEDGIRVYTFYRMLVADPTTPANVALTQTLYNRLTNAGLAPTTPSTLILADEDERQRYSLERIEAAANDDWVAFSTILKDIMDVSEQTSRKRRRQRGNQRATMPQPATAQT